jgi:cytochrome c553
MTFPALLVAMVLAFGVSPARAVGGAQMQYMLHCMGCHLDDGSGMPAKGIPAMKGVVGHFLRLPEGRALMVQVPGVMNTPLDDRQVAELMNWLMLHIAGDSRPQDSAPYTADEVKALRASRPADLLGERARIVRRLRAAGYPVN